MRQIDIYEIAANAKFNSFHRLLLVMCCLIIVADGYDLAVMGVGLPAIMKDMAVSPQQAGFMASAAIFGMMLGAIVIGTIADRIGRRPTMMGCLAVLGVGTTIAGLTTGPISFGLARFVTGIAIGGVMPCVVTQLTEFAPRTRRATMVTIAYSGFAIGGIVAAVVGRAMIESYGWRAGFVGAGLEVLCIPLIYRFMPESLALKLRTCSAMELQRLVRTLDPRFDIRPDDRFVGSPSASGVGGPAHSQLFQDGRGLSTAMFWTASFMCLFVTYGLTTWLVKLMANAGYSLGSALNFILAFNIGGLIGQIGGGLLSDRFRIKWVLFAMFLLSSAGILMLSHKMPTAWLYVFVGVVGGAIFGTQTLTYAYAGQFYPVGIRGAGVGWISAVGRVGAVIAPIVFGYLVAAQLPLEQNFLVVAIAPVIAAIDISLTRRRRSEPAPAALQDAWSKAG